MGWHYLNKQLVPILADAVREYYDPDELVQLCGLWDSDLEWDGQRQKPAYLGFAQRLLTQPEHGNNRRILEALLPSLFSRCSEMIAKSDYEKKQYHEELDRRMNALRPLLGTEPTPREISVPDGRPFTAKSEIRDLLNTAEGPVLLVDAYIGVGTLDCVRSVPHPIRILTGQQKQSVAPGFDRAANDFIAEGHLLEVRSHPKLHDRYLIFNERCWLVGSSIKDAGKKALNIIECVDSKQSIVGDAEKKWTEAIALS